MPIEARTEQGCNTPCLAPCPQDKTVVELGCGLGLVAITAAVLGARVTATDGDSGVLRAARGNVASNGAGCRHPVAVQPLQWGDAAGVRSPGECSAVTCQFGVNCRWLCETGLLLW